MERGTSTAEFDELRAQSQRCLVDFLRAELLLGFTFADTAAAERSFGDIEHFGHAKGEAGKAAGTIRRFIDRVSSPETRAALFDRCAELDRALAAL